jgi:hypothetical protein
MKKTLGIIGMLAKNEVIIREIIESIKNPEDVSIILNAIGKFNEVKKLNAQKIKEFVDSTYNSLSQETLKAFIDRFVTSENLKKEFKITNIKPEDSSKAVFLELIYIKSKEQKPEIIEPTFDILTKISDKGIYNQNPEAQKFCIETFQQVINDAPVFIEKLSKGSILNLIKNSYMTASLIEKVYKSIDDESEKVKLSEFKDFASEFETLSTDLSAGIITQDYYLLMTDALEKSLTGYGDLGFDQ